MKNSVKSRLFTISVKESVEGNKHFEIKESADDLSLGENISPIDVKGYFFKNGRKVFINGAVDCDAEMVCSRCGKKYLQHIKGNFKLLFMPEEKRHFKEEENVDLFFYGEDEINFAPHIRDTVLLEIPIKPLCSCDCTGIEY